jgi:hypothetical protein
MALVCLGMIPALSLQGSKYFPIARKPKVHGSPERNRISTPVPADMKDPGMDFGG